MEVCSHLNGNIGSDLFDGFLSCAGVCVASGISVGDMELLVKATSLVMALAILSLGIMSTRARIWELIRHHQGMAMVLPCMAWPGLGRWQGFAGMICH
jgi:hypothetical protein